MQFFEKDEEDIVNIADPIWDNLVEGSNEMNYEKISKHFSKRMLEDVDEINLAKQWETNQILTSLSTRREYLVVHAENKVTFRVAVWGRIKARFAVNGPALSKKRNAESPPHSRSRRAAAQSILDCVAALGKDWAIPCGLRLAKIDCAAAEHYLIFRMDH